MLSACRTPLGAAWTCARCDSEPGHADDLEAFAAGYTSSSRELHGREPFTVCASCVRVEAQENYRGNVEYWTGVASELRSGASAANCSSEPRGRALHP